MIENHFTVSAALAELADYAERGFDLRRLQIETEDGVELEIVDVRLTGAGYVLVEVRPADVKTN